MSEKPARVERRANRRDAAVHHVARRDDVGAGARVRHRFAREQLERRVVVDVAVANHAAVPVLGVLAEADVGDHDELGHLALERAHGLLHRRVVVPRFGARRVLRVGNAEQQHAADAERRGLARVAAAARRRTSDRRPASSRLALGCRRPSERTAAARAATAARQSRARGGAARRSDAGGGVGTKGMMAARPKAKRRASRIGSKAPRTATSCPPIATTQPRTSTHRTGYLVGAAAHPDHRRR